MGTYHAVWNAIKKYFVFIVANKRIYLVFNKQLIVGGLAGLLTGVAVAEAISFFTEDEILISVPRGLRIIRRLSSDSW